MAIVLVIFVEIVHVLLLLVHPNGDVCTNIRNCANNICESSRCVATSSGGSGKYCVAIHPKMRICHHIVASFKALTIFLTIHIRSTLHSPNHITVQSLCDLLLMDSPEASDEMGITTHTRHATTKKMMLGKEYTFISNIVLRVGDTVW